MKTEISAPFELRIAPVNVNSKRADPPVTSSLVTFCRIFDELLDTKYDPAAASKTADRHHAILLAIKASDPRGARIALHSHFDGLRNRIGGRDFKID